MMTEQERTALVEELADIEHQRWAGWPEKDKPMTDNTTPAEAVKNLLDELRHYADHFQPAVEDDNNYYRGDCPVDGKDAAMLGEICGEAADLIERLLAEGDIDALVGDMGYATGLHVQYQGHHYQHKPTLAASKAYTASVEVLVEPDPDNDGFGGWNVSTGTGPTRTAALRNAVQRAKEQGNE